MGGMGGLIGLDYSPILKMAEIEGLDLRVLTYLLPWAESGLLSGINKQKDARND